MKNNKLLILILVLASMSATFAQGGKLRQKMEQVKSMKIAFITSELALTPEESAKFWPVYNTFEARQKEIKKQRVSAYLDRRDGASVMTDKEASALLAQMENNEEQLHQLRKKLVADLKGILPAIKIIRLKKAEEDFNKKLLEQYRNKRLKR